LSSELTRPVEDERKRTEQFGSLTQLRLHDVRIGSRAGDCAKFK
jgi:hypothetical protein